MTLQQLLSPARRAIEQYNMISEGDKIAVGLSGGKDSLALLDIMAGLKRFYPKSFELYAITVDMGLNYDNDELSAIEQHLKDLDVQWIVEKSQIGEILFEVRKEQNPCSLCSKMRRGALCTVANEHNINKIALGHHADDLIETFFLSMFYEGRLSTFSPVSYLSRSNTTIIRPMVLIEEKDISAYMRDKTILHNPCPADKHTQRQYVKDLLNSVKKDIPFVKKRIHSAIIHPERYNLFTINDDI